MTDEGLIVLGLVFGICMAVMFIVGHQVGHKAGYVEAWNRRKSDAAAGRPTDPTHVT